MTSSDEVITLGRSGKQSERDAMTSSMRTEAREQLGDVDLVEDWHGEYGTQADWPNDGDLTLTLDYRRLGDGPAREGATVVPAINSAGDKTGA